MSMPRQNHRPLTLEPEEAKCLYHGNKGLSSLTIRDQLNQVYRSLASSQSYSGSGIKVTCSSFAEPKVKLGDRLVGDAPHLRGSPGKHKGESP